MAHALILELILRVPVVKLELRRRGALHKGNMTDRQNEESLEGIEKCSTLRIRNALFKIQKCKMEHQRIPNTSVLLQKTRPDNSEHQDQGKIQMGGGGGGDAKNIPNSMQFLSHGTHFYPSCLNKLRKG